jgi:hypothetical protein
MDLLEGHTRSFIVRCRAEGSPPEEERERWLCQVIEVPSGEKRYFSDLDRLVDFLAPHLREAGVRLTLYWRLRLWARGATRKLTALWRHWLWRH